MNSITHGRSPPPTSSQLCLETASLIGKCFSSENNEGLSVYLLFSGRSKSTLFWIDQGNSRQEPNPLLNNFLGIFFGFVKSLADVIASN